MMKVLLLVMTIFISTVFVSSFSSERKVSKATAEDLLTSRSWQLRELRFLQQNKDYFYKRNVTGDIAGLETESIKFNLDHTGTYTAGGIEYRLTWEFVNENKDELQYVLNEATPLLVTWENLKLSETLMEYTEYYRRGRMNSLASGKRIPVENSELITYK